MPVLAHLKQALLKLYSQNEGYYNAKPKTKVSKDKSTPILIHGIERLCHVRLDKKYVACFVGLLTCQFGGRTSSGFVRQPFCTCLAASSG